MPEQNQQKILILDFGAQYSQLIARRVRECHVYSEVKPFSVSLEEIQSFAPAGIIFSGGPGSVYEAGSPHPAEGIYDLGIPILGICYGCQLLAQRFGGEVVPAISGTAREYGKAVTWFDNRCRLFTDLPGESVTWMSHGDLISILPKGFASAAYSAVCPTACIYDELRRLYGVQFHPEVTHTLHGREILQNFLFRVCHCSQGWTMADFRQKTVQSLREKIGDGKVLLALSGGVDSSVAAALLSEAIGSSLICIFVDHGLLRKDEGDEIEAFFSRQKLTFHRVDASRHFLTCLARINDPERKRKIIGEEFIRTFEQEARKIGKVDFLAQGTIYPDVIESGAGSSAVIKSHHNVGGLPDHVAFREILEPLRLLFKDEVRELGLALGLPENLVNRQPFPGPGLAIRVIGEVTQRKLKMLREADAIFREEMEKSGDSRTSGQYFAALTNMRSVGVMGDGRTYEYAVVLRSVKTDDFMTAEWSRLPYDLLERASSRIVNEVEGVNRVLYDITSKPPATVEYE
ncbi:MAG: glutamine-hydrolyzing GMP synthase [Oscillospiraceae bacterium]|nr:glutamine-hydrolyzing GMP synthase [Oscillospiraceae bacterium]